MITLRRAVQVLLVLVPICFLGETVSGSEQDQKVSLQKISISSKGIDFQLEGDSAETFELFELAPYQAWDKAGKDQPVWKGQIRDQLKLSLPRFEKNRDRLFSKWLLVDSDSGDPVGPAKYVSDYQQLRTRRTRFLHNKSIKGLQCIVDDADAIALKVKHATRNIHITQIVDLSGKSKTYQKVDGERIPINMGFINSLDQVFKGRTEAGINNIVILLNPIPTEPNPDNPFIHPLSNLKEAPNHLGAFNLTDRKGLLYYRGAIEFLANRYSRTDQKYGLVSGYIIGNELQSHWWWHNLGEVGADVVVPDYALALRMAYSSARKYSDEIRVYASLEHHWTATNSPNPKRALPGKLFLDEMNSLIRKQGNFNWSMAYHPYPENLFEARTWNDKQPTLDFNTPKITFKNLEVLVAYLSQPQFLFEGKLRKIILSEQGFHKPDGPDGEKIQAAAYAYAFYRTSQLPQIDAFILHRHVDHAHEGGLRLGVREFREGTVTAPGKKRLLYDVFRDADSENWQQVFEFALPVIGIKDWKEVDPKPVGESN